MEKPLLYTCSTDIEDTEMELLEEILENYDIKYNIVEKVRSAYRIADDNNAYCLKMLGRGYKRGHKSFFLSNALRERGFENVAPYVFTKNNEYLIKHKKSSFYITGWIKGGEVSFNSLDDILDCARFLAEFHKVAKGMEIPHDIKIRNRHNNWLEHFNKHIEEVKGFEKKISKKSKSTGFDLIFKNNFNIFMSEAEFAVSLLKTDAALRALEEGDREKYICHDSFYYQNILRDETGKLFLIDLESSLLDSPMSDVGKFIRRIICKTKYKWDFDLCRRIIDAYDSVRPISNDELYLLLAMIAFPHKYWKFSKKRYIKKKQWSEEDFQNKLKKLINLQNYKFEFVRNFVLFYGIKLD
jgi:CotS family spore coat protein